MFGPRAERNSLWFVRSVKANWESYSISDWVECEAYNYALLEISVIQCGGSCWLWVETNERGREERKEGSIYIFELNKSVWKKNDGNSQLPAHENIWRKKSTNMMIFFSLFFRGSFAQFNCCYLCLVEFTNISFLCHPICWLKLFFSFFLLFFVLSLFSATCNPHRSILL